MGLNTFLAWFHGHKHTPLTPTPDNIPSPVFQIPAPTDTPYTNGMKDPVAGGFVTLEQAELLRAHCLSSGNPKLVLWAETALPYRYAIDAAPTMFTMSEWDAKSCDFNCQAAYMFFEMLAPGQKLDTTTWCPQVGFVAGPPVPGSGKLYSQTNCAPGYTAFGPSVTPDMLQGIFANILAHL